MASLCRAATKRGVPPEAIQETRSKLSAGGISRRGFLRTAVGGAGAFLALPRLRAVGDPQPRIAIVGAGISGLNCALTLADNGIASTVYESSARIGGRMFSNNIGYWDENQVTEWCGEFIDTSHTTLQSLATWFGLALDDVHAGEPVNSTETYYFDHGYYSAADAVTDFMPVFTAVQADYEAADEGATYDAINDAGIALDNISVWQWIETRVPGGHQSKMGQLLDVAYAIEYGADTRDQSSLNLVLLLAGSDESLELFGESDERFHVRGGNQLIPQSIAIHLANIGQPVELGMRLEAIRKLADGTFSLAFANHGVREVIADIVVLTLPFAVLRTLEFSKAGFDALKKKAIHELGRGRNGKLQLQFKDRLWNTDGPWGLSNGTSYADTGYQNTWDATRSQPGTPGILNDYTGGSVVNHLAAAVPFAFHGNSGAHRDAATFLRRIAAVYPGLASRWNGKLTSSIPHLSPQFRLAYSYWRVGQYQSFAGYEGIRQGNIFFAGEHTSVDYQGFMEGAAEEGERAADEILTQLGVMV